VSDDEGCGDEGCGAEDFVSHDRGRGDDGDHLVRDVACPQEAGAHVVAPRRRQLTECGLSVL